MATEAKDDGKKWSGIRSHLHKTKFCWFHMQGLSCKFGDECSFAHTTTEMQQTPDLRKTQICKAFLEGQCQDQNCGFAHSSDELRATEFCFKKKLCMWNAKGMCRNGARCRFAHGLHEMRNEPDVRNVPAPPGLGMGDPLKESAVMKLGDAAVGPSCKNTTKNGGRGSISGQSNASTTSGGSSRKSNSTTSTPVNASSGTNSFAIGEPLKLPDEILQALVASEEIDFHGIDITQNSPPPTCLAKPDLNQASMQAEIEALRHSVAALTCHYMHLQESVAVAAAHRTYQNMGGLGSDPTANLWRNNGAQMGGFSHPTIHPRYHRSSV